MPRTRVPERLEKRAREIVEALDGTWSRSRGMCCCPAHDDRTPSLSVTIGVRAILFHCFAGCSNEAVLASLDRIGVKAAELFDGRGEPIAPWTRDEVANQNALRLWRAASALTDGPAQAYLAGRQIRISSCATTPEHRLAPRDRSGFCLPCSPLFATTRAYWHFTGHSLSRKLPAWRVSMAPSARWAALARARCGWPCRAAAGSALLRASKAHFQPSSSLGSRVGRPLAMSGLAW